jgi:PAS domain S-box-containing protein
VFLPDSTRERIPAPSSLATSELRDQSYNSLLEAVIRSSDDAIITRDLNGIITSWNPAATAIFGYQPEEIIGQSVLRLIPDRLHPEEEEVVRRLKAGQQIAHYETTRMTKSGEEVHVSLTISPLKNEEGEIVGASKVARNIGQQKQLDRARLQLAAIVESSEDAIISKDLSGIILSWNCAAERLFGYTEQEIVGSSVLRLIPEDLHSEEPVILSKLMAGERIEHFETTRLRKNGQRFEASLTISPIRDASGRVIGASKILRDITDRKQLEHSLLQAEKIAATGRMAATIAHEINNPLEGLLNLIYLAKQSASTPGEVVAYLSTAESELARVSHIAQQTLGFYREQSSPVSASAADLIRDVLAIYEPKLKHGHIQVHSSFQSVPSIVVRKGEIMQVLSNLVANAIHAMPQGGRLSASVRAVTCDNAAGLPRQGSLIEIEDTGVGISTENLRRVFEPFFTTRGSIGTGIGLWIARQFIEGHGGSIDIRSSVDPSSHGTTLSIFLPSQDLRN